MERIDQILQHPAYREALSKIEDLEKTRIFCGHDFTHFLDVARIAYIMNLEEGTKIPKAQIYAAALLHDIGRHEQYLYGTPHHEASAKIAGKILSECGFLEEEKANILEAILEHRAEPGNQSDLSAVLYRADKMSRPCYRCKAEPECHWSDTKKNNTIQY